MKSRLLMAFAALALWGWGTPKSRSEQTVDYLRQIKPLLTEKCIACHGVLKQKGKLRLDTAALARKGGKHGPALHASQASYVGSIDYFGPPRRVPFQPRLNVPVCYEP